jgi:glycosyltransferase involved in cell wall biosynthesis
VIGTYGDASWEALAKERALPSAEAVNPYEILIGHDPEGSVATFRNRLAEKAKGDWLLFLDADDAISENYLLAMSAVWGKQASRNGTPTLLTPATSYVRSGGRRPRARVIPRADLRYMNWLIVGTLTPRSLFEELGGFRDWPHGLEDWDYWTRAERRGVEIVEVPKAIYYAYWSKDSEHRKLFRQRSTQVYWHQAVGHDVWPEIYAAPTEEEIAAQSMRALRYVEGARPKRRGCGCKGVR